VSTDLEIQEVYLSDIVQRQKEVMKGHGSEWLERYEIVNQELSVHRLYDGILSHADMELLRIIADADRPAGGTND